MILATTMPLLKFTSPQMLVDLKQANAGMTRVTFVLDIATFDYNRDRNSELSIRAKVLNMGYLPNMGYPCFSRCMKRTLPKPD